jgi:hypothetical protein
MNALNVRLSLVFFPPWSFPTNSQLPIANRQTGATNPQAATDHQSTANTRGAAFRHSSFVILHSLSDVPGSSLITHHSSLVRPPHAH